METTMNQSIYINTSFFKNGGVSCHQLLVELTEIAKTTIDKTVLMTKTEMGKLVGKSVSTISTQLTKLKEMGVCDVESKSGRGGKTLVVFNQEFVQFATSEESSLVNGTKPEQRTTEEIKGEVLAMAPKRKPKTDRKRRNSKQIEADLLKRRAVDGAYNLANNDIIEGVIPQWETFKKSPTAVEDFKAYIVSVMYTRYAYLAIESHNKRHEKNVESNKEDSSYIVMTRKIPQINQNYSPFKDGVFGSKEMTYFKNFIKMCDEEGIDIGTYLSAQMNRYALVTGRLGGKNNSLPYLSTLKSAEGMEIYRNHIKYCDKGELRHWKATANYDKYAFDVIISMCQYALTSTNYNDYTLERKYDAFFAPTTNKGLSMLNYFNNVSETMEAKGTSETSQRAIKDFIVRQTLLLTRGTRDVTKTELFMSAMFSTTLADLSNSTKHDNPKSAINKDTDWYNKVCHTVGKYILPNAEGTMTEWNKILRDMVEIDKYRNFFNLVDLIQEYKGNYISWDNLHAAFKEVGFNTVPVTKFSQLDIDAITREFSPFVLEQESFISSMGEYTPKYNIKKTELDVKRDEIRAEQIKKESMLADDIQAAIDEEMKLW
ncbi:HTH binding domain protein [Bacillus phage Eyuki]|uniref:HTH binding domain protein n=1 Tax=Bacillus phage Eyuki TaxID=1690431 RepID=A0A0K2FL95_9CAUD|nr:HTH binding domain protein [Bacillus phage Eyuki]ALA46777.1 HTH binding domain protein [Bacillus phage Eyuki]